MELRPKYECPSCERAVLNRKINKCLYCGAELPEALLFTKEEIAAMDAKDRNNQEQKNRHLSSHFGSGAGSGFDLGDAIDIASDVGGFFD